jgi:toxin FitB
VTAVLFDTNVLSELVRPRPDARVAAFVRDQHDPYLSVVTLHELTYGAERAPAAARRAKLIAWIAALRAQFAGRIVPVTEEIAEHAGRLRAAAELQGRPTEAIDALIAASALSRGAALATRDTSDFEPLGVTLINPWNA